MEDKIKKEQSETWRKKHKPESAASASGMAGTHDGSSLGDAATISRWHGHNN